MSQDRNHDASPFGPSAFGADLISRRGLLARLVALSVALGLATMREGEAIAAKNGK